ncbi:MAG: protein TolR [Gammaproteobacteria bacterium]|nr:protein TolR [Gammaproteobacteria bacterium]
MPAPVQRTRSRRRPMSEINVVPYIDVMLVLLVIFMVTAPLLTQGVRVQLPQAESQPVEQTDSKPVVLTVDESGRFFLDLGADPTEPLAPATVVARVRAYLEREPQAKVLVKGNDASEYQHVLNGMVLLQQAGAKSVGLLTRPPAK